MTSNCSIFVSKFNSPIAKLLKNDTHNYGSDKTCKDIIILAISFLVVINCDLSLRACARLSSAIQEGSPFTQHRLQGVTFIIILGSSK